MLKKISLTIAALAVIAFCVLCGVAGYVYTRDLGVDYKGRARLDYNWKYYFAKCPKENYHFEGKLFSFSYPVFSIRNPLWEVVDDEGGLLSSDDYYLDIVWRNKVPPFVRIELTERLVFAGSDLPAFSKEFMQWVLLESDMRFMDSGMVYNTQLKKMALNGGGKAVLISLRSKIEERPHCKYIVGITPGGQVFKVRFRGRINATEASYRRWVFSRTKSWIKGFRPEQDAQCACVLNRFLNTFQYKK